MNFQSLCFYVVSWERKERNPLESSPVFSAHKGLVIGVAMTTHTIQLFGESVDSVGAPPPHTHTHQIS